MHPTMPRITLRTMPHIIPITPRITHITLPHRLHTMLLHRITPHTMRHITHRIMHIMLPHRTMPRIMLLHLQRIVEMDFVIMGRRVEHVHKIALQRIVTIVHIKIIMLHRG